MRRFTLAVALAGYGLFWLIACVIAGPLARAMRRPPAPNRPEIGYDDNDPGIDVDGDPA